jgi:SAM-dependent methyltransferase
MGNHINVSWTHYLREQECEFLKALISGRRVLEIGSGDGHAALLMKSYAAKVVATDIAPRHPMVSDVFQIKDMADYEELIELHQIDTIVSFHVVEHVKNLPAFLDQFQINGKRLCHFHIVPTNRAVILNFVFQPAAYVRSLALLFNGYYLRYARDRNANFFKLIVKRLNPLRIFWPSRHGEYTAADALIFWRKIHWIKHIGEEISYEHIALAYSFHKLFPFQFLPLRKIIGRCLSSSALISFTK